jgi:uncharacterized protein YkwD
MIRMTTRTTARILTMALGLVAAAQAAPPPRSIPDRLYERLDEARKVAGLPDWERRAGLDRAAAQAAEEVARVNGRALDRPIEVILEGLGVSGVQRAIPVVQVLRGYDQPVQVAFDHWKHYRHVWDELMNPDVDAIGLGESRTSDGSLVLVGVLVNDAVPIDLAELELTIARAVNDARAEHGLDPLSLSTELSEIARLHSIDMVTRGYFNHRSPGGGPVASRMFGAGVIFDQVAENISKVEGAQDPAAVAVRGWLASTGHRANILSGEFDESGVGIASDTDGALFLTQVFTKGARWPRKGPE